MQYRQQIIEEHAYRIWEQEGRPEGRQHEHWLRAEKEVDATLTQDRGVTEAVEADPRPTPTKAQKRSKQPSTAASTQPAKRSRSMGTAATGRKRKAATESA